MKNNFQAIIFDLDGTLVDTEVVWHEAETKLVEARGHVYTLEAREHLIGMRLDEGLSRLRDHYQFPDDIPTLIDELNRNMLALIEVDIRPNPGIAELIDYVLEQNLPHAIASASPTVIIDAIVERMGWGEIFPIRCSADDEARGKPAPDVYVTAARRVNVAPEYCLALEDTLNGARAAVGAGMTCYVVPDAKYTKHDAFADVTPHVFHNFHEVLAKLQG